MHVNFTVKFQTERPRVSASPQSKSPGIKNSRQTSITNLNQAISSSLLEGLCSSGWLSANKLHLSRHCCLFISALRGPQRRRMGVVPKARSGFGLTRKGVGRQWNVWVRNRGRKFSSWCICKGKQRNCEQNLPNATLYTTDPYRPALRRRQVGK